MALDVTAIRKEFPILSRTVRGGKPLVSCYAGKLGELRAGGNNFSFVAFGDLDAANVAALFAEAADIFKADKENPVRYMQGD